MIHVFENKQEVAQSAAELLLKVSIEAVAKNGRFLVAFSGGSTPALLYQLLRERPYVEQLPWHHTHVFWGDERLVPPTDEGSNFKQANDLLLQHVPIPEENLHRAMGEGTPEEAVADYLNQLQLFASQNESIPVFDLILLGMGNDGHTASLFPGKIPVGERDTAVITVTANYDGRPANRISFTPLLINKAQHILVLVTGTSKADTISHVLYGDANPEQWPIQRIKPTSGLLHWYLDKPAAGKIKQ